MESLNMPNNESAQTINMVEIMTRFGIGHMPENTLFSIENIDQNERNEIIETYKLSLENIESLLE